MAVACIPVCVYTMTHLTNARTWLVGNVELTRSGQPGGVSEPYEGIRRLVEYAELLGLPSGTEADVRAVEQSLLHPVLGTLVTASARGGDASLHVLQPPRLGREDNDCNFCECFQCQSNKFGGVTKCASRHDSTVDISKFRAGPRDYAEKGRAYHKANPEIKTLKGVKLATRKTGKKGGGMGTIGGTTSPPVRCK